MTKLNKHDEMLIVGGVAYSRVCTGAQLNPPYATHYEKISGEGPNVDVAIAQYNYKLSLHKSKMPNSTHSAKPY